MILIGTTTNQCVVSHTGSFPELVSFGRNLAYWAIFWDHLSHGPFHNATDSRYLVAHWRDPFWLNCGFLEQYDYSKAPTRSIHEAVPVYIARSCGGLNAGYHDYLLDLEGEKVVFEDKDAAVNFLYDAGIEDLDGFIFEPVTNKIKESAAPYYPSFKVYSRRSEDDYKLIGFFVGAAEAILHAEQAFNTNKVEAVYVTREETIYDHAKPPYREIRESASNVYQPLLIDAADHTPTGRKAQRRSVDRTMAKIRKLHEDLNAALYSHPTERPSISNPQDAVQILAYFLTGLEQEEFWVLNLDTKNRISHCVKLYVGTVNQSNVRVAEVFRQAIIDNNPSIIIGHNHPSGDPTPSPDDINVTRCIVQAGGLLDIDVLDHLVIGEPGRFVSMKERQLGFN